VTETKKIAQHYKGLQITILLFIHIEALRHVLER